MTIDSFGSLETGECIKLERLNLAEHFAIVLAVCNSAEGRFFYAISHTGDVLCVDEGTERWTMTRFDLHDLELQNYTFDTEHDIGDDYLADRFEPAFKDFFRSLKERNIATPRQAFA